MLFDLDGTLLDTLHDIADAANLILKKEGFATHPVESYKYFIGDGLEKMVFRALPEDCRSEETVKRVFQNVRQYYFNNWDIKTNAYPGIPELLDALQHEGMKLTVLSNKVHDVTSRMIPRFFENIAFEIVLGSRPGVPRKPDPTAALEISERIDIPAEKFIYLGDTATDMKTARRAGMFAVGAAWGFRTKEELVENGAMAVIEEPGNLLELLQE